MIQKLKLKDIHAAVMDRVETGTGLKAYDAVPVDAIPPFYIVELINREPVDSKTLFRELITVYVHGIAEKGSSIGVYDLITGLEEAMTEDVTLPAGFTLIQQIDNGLSGGIQTDETGEKHSICSYGFDVCYGAKIK